MGPCQSRRCIQRSCEIKHELSCYPVRKVQTNLLVCKKSYVNKPLKLTSNNTRQSLLIRTRPRWDWLHVFAASMAVSHVQSLTYGDQSTVIHMWMMGWCISSTTMWICCCGWQTSRQTPKKYYETFPSVIVFSLLYNATFSWWKRAHRGTDSQHVYCQTLQWSQKLQIILELRYWVVTSTATK